MATVEERLERLERSQKRYRFATIGLLCLMVAGVSMGQAPQDLEKLKVGVLEAQLISCSRIFIHNENGNGKILLEAEKMG